MQDKLQQHHSLMLTNRKAVAVDWASNIEGSESQDRPLLLEDCDNLAGNGLEIHTEAGPCSCRMKKGKPP